MNTTHLQRGNHLSDVGRHDEAAREFAAAVAQTPDDAIAHGLLAMSLSRTSRFDAAQSHAQETLRLLADCGWPHFVMGVVLYQKNECIEAEEFAKKAIQLQPGIAEYFHLLACIRAGLGRDREALEANHSCLRLAPEHAHALNLRSWLLRHRSEHSSADIAARASLAIHPENSDAHVNIGLSFAVEGSYTKAFGEFQEALRLDPNSQAAHGGIAIARSFRALTIMFGFYAIVGSFLAVVALSSSNFGCFQILTAVVVVLVILVFWRRLWHSLGWHRRMRFR